jgi:hypothetical protein
MPGEREVERNYFSFLIVCFYSALIWILYFNYLIPFLFSDETFVDAERRLIQEKKKSLNQLKALARKEAPLKELIRHPFFDDLNGIFVFFCCCFDLLFVCVF